MFREEDTAHKATDVVMMDGTHYNVDFERGDVFFNNIDLKQFLPGLKFPDLCNNKKIEMRKKYRILIPEKHQDYYMYNTATPEMIQKEKDEKKDKMRHKQMTNLECKCKLETAVKKSFDGKWFLGKVVAYKGKYYKILYNDGDKEDFDIEDMENI